MTHLRNETDLCLSFHCYITKIQSEVALHKIGSHIRKWPGSDLKRNHICAVQTVTKNTLHGGKKSDLCYFCLQCEHSLWVSKTVFVCIFIAVLFKLQIMQHGSPAGVRWTPMTAKVPRGCCLARQYRPFTGEQTGLPNMDTTSAPHPRSSVLQELSAPRMLSSPKNTILGVL